MKGNHKRIGKLLWNDRILAWDILFPDGSNWGGLAEGDTFEVLNSNGVWVQTCLLCNGFNWYLQGIEYFFGMFARI